MEVVGRKLKLSNFSKKNARKLKVLLQANSGVTSVEIRCKEIHIEGFISLASFLPQYKNIAHLVIKQARSYTNDKIYGYSAFLSKMLPQISRITINAEKTTSKIMLYTLASLKYHNVKQLDLGAIGWGEISIRRKIKMIFTLNSLENLSFGETALKELIATIDMSDERTFKIMRKTTLIITRFTSSKILPFFSHAKDSLAMFIKPFPRNEVPGVRALLAAMEKVGKSTKVRIASFHRYENRFPLITQLLPGQFARRKITVRVRDQSVIPSVTYITVVRQNCRPNELWAEFQAVARKKYLKRFDFRKSFGIGPPLIHSHPLDNQGIRNNAIVHYGVCLKRR